MIQQLGELNTLAETQVWFPASTWLITICNSTSMGSPTSQQTCAAPGSNPGSLV